MPTLEEAIARAKTCTYITPKHRIEMPRSVLNDLGDIFDKSIDMSSMYPYVQSILMPGYDRLFPSFGTPSKEDDEEGMDYRKIANTLKATIEKVN